MLKKICVFLAIGLVLMTAACGGNTTAADTSGDSASTASGSEENVLILGTLKLEDTDQAITADQASELLVLWKAMRVLSSSDTTSQAELDALFQQINLLLFDRNCFVNFGCFFIEKIGDCNLYF